MFETLTVEIFKSKKEYKRYRDGFYGDIRKEVEGKNLLFWITLYEMYDILLRKFHMLSHQKTI